MREMKIKNWFKDHRAIIGEAVTGFCVGTAAAYWVTVIIAAIKGLKIAWVPRK